ncbi:MAG: DNA alkylation repair protein [Planctomycetes bacterium]|nr:DNA alkylation repair protein [Planctomycetota bacterium]
MTLDEVMKSLESAGSAQTRKTYARHGVRGKVFGVSYAHLGKLTKKIKCDEPLAEQLWATGVHDARVLATMIADPKAISGKTLDAWAKDLDGHAIGGALAGLVARTPHAVAKSERWAKSTNEWIAQVAWNVIGRLATDDPSIPDSWFDGHLDTIQSEIHDQKNRVRHAMNGALIGIGIRNAAIRKKALAVAKSIGVVEVDHGDTDCKTPDAATYIAKALARKC